MADNRITFTPLTSEDPKTDERAVRGEFIINETTGETFIKLADDRIVSIVEAGLGGTGAGGSEITLVSDNGTF
jgi:hypothetical protein